MKLSKHARRVLAKNRERGKLKLRQAATGALVGASAGLAFQDRFQDIAGIDWRLVAGAGAMWFGGRGKYGSFMQGAGFGLLVVPAAQFAVSAVEQSPLAGALGLEESAIAVPEGISRPDGRPVGVRP